MTEPVLKDNLILISGKAASGKTTALRKLHNPSGVMYLNCENKRVSFPNCQFQQYGISNPHQVPEGIKFAETQKDVHTIIVDTFTHMMGAYESMFIANAVDTRAAWGQYSEFIRSLMYVTVANSSKNIIFTAHESSELDENTQQRDCFVPLKGAMKRIGLESFFATIVGARQLALSELEKPENKNALLTFTEKEKRRRFKYVLQTEPMTVGEKMRAPMDMWEENELYIDSDISHVVQRLEDFYGQPLVGTPPSAQSAPAVA